MDINQSLCRIWNLNTHLEYFTVMIKKLPIISLFTSFSSFTQQEIPRYPKVIPNS